MVFTVIVILTAVIFTAAGCRRDSIDGGRHDNSDASAPKVIESQDIVSFSCEFSTDNVSGCNGPLEYCRFTMDKQEGGVSCTASGRADGQSFSVEFTAAADALSELQTIINEAEVAK